MRDITDVINRMLAIAPLREMVLRDNLRKVAKDTAYTAPEAVNARWRDLAWVFSERFEGAEMPDWGHAMGRILAGID